MIKLIFGVKETRYVCGKINKVCVIFTNVIQLLSLNSCAPTAVVFVAVCCRIGRMHPCIEDVAIAWRKGLKRVWDLPLRTHSAMVAPICGLLQLKAELLLSLVDVLNLLLAA